MALDPPYIEASIWDVQRRLEFEKLAIGSFLSGHLFDQNREEVRKFIPTEIANLVDSRETLQIAGIVENLRIVNGQRGRAAIFTLDDKSGGIEAVAAEEVLIRHPDLLVDDGLLICTGRVQKDRFSGGLRFNVQDVMTLEGARLAFGRYIHLHGEVTSDAILSWLRSFGLLETVASNLNKAAGLPVRVALSFEGVLCTVDLGEQTQVDPSDGALAAWTSRGGSAAVMYQPDTA
jgi:DNA polymerase-3 subunit alpha